MPTRPGEAMMLRACLLAHGTTQTFPINWWYTWGWMSHICFDLLCLLHVDVNSGLRVQQPHCLQPGGLCLGVSDGGG